MDRIEVYWEAFHPGLLACSIMIYSSLVFKLERPKLKSWLSHLVGHVPGLSLNQIARIISLGCHKE